MTVKLTREGQFLTRDWNKPTQWNEEQRRYEDEGYYTYRPLTSAEDLILAWNEQIILSENATLRSLMTALRSIPDIDKIGPYVVNGYIKEFIDEAFTPAERDSKVVEFRWYWIGECGKDHVVGDDFDDPNANWREISNRLDIYSNISGRAAQEETDEYHGYTGWVNYSIDGCPQNVFMDCKLVLVEDLEITDRNNWSDEPKLKASKIWTLGAFLYTYLYELSWHGSPQGRDDFNDQMTKQLEEIHNGTAKLYSLEDLDRAIMGDEFVDDLIDKGEYDGGLPPK